MRIKRAPLRATGTEGTGCIPKSVAPDVNVSASIKMEENTLFESHSVKGHQGRSVVSRKGGIANHMDDETEVAKFKLRQQELLGHIKVEMDEVSGRAPQWHLELQDGGPHGTAFHPL